MFKKAPKPLNGKAYGSIGHLPGSRLGTGDHCVDQGMAKILTEHCRGRRIIVQEKLDGSAVAVLRLDGKFIPLNRKGYPAISSPYVNHHLFHWWAMDNVDRFARVLREGERIVGEWLAQAIGTRYDLSEGFDPFMPFDIFYGGSKKRISYLNFSERVDLDFDLPHCLHNGYEAMPVDEAMRRHEIDRVPSDGIEGVVYRAERNGEVEFLAKHVVSDKVDGKYMFNGQEVWNWRPTNGG